MSNQSWNGSWAPQPPAARPPKRLNSLAGLLLALSVVMAGGGVALLATKDPAGASPTTPTAAPSSPTTSGSSDTPEPTNDGNFPKTGHKKLVGRTLPHQIGDWTLDQDPGVLGSKTSNFSYRKKSGEFVLGTYFAQTTYDARADNLQQVKVVIPDGVCGRLTLGTYCFQWGTDGYVYLYRGDDVPPEDVELLSKAVYESMT